MTDSLRRQFASEAVSRHFDDAALLAAMARFEAALAWAEADCGRVPAAAAACIESVCVAGFGPRAAVQRAPEEAPLRSLSATLDADLFAPATLVPAARRAGMLAIPFVQRLTAAVAQVDAEAARWVHWGATSQDLADTALTLACQAANAALLGDLQRVGDALARLAEDWRDTPITGRTLLQAATPVPFGWKVAGWLAPLARSRAALATAGTAMAVIQLGGATGIRAALEGHGDAVAARLAARLGLNDPGSSWHGARDRVARLGSELGLLTGALARIGRDLSLLMQTELAEVTEPEGDGRGGSSAMPHKRNPVASMLALQAGLKAPGLVATLLAQQAGEHERGLGTWQADWWTMGALYECAGSASAAMAEALGGLRVDAAAMQANLARGGGFVYAEAVTLALAQTLGRPAAQAWMTRLCDRARQAGEPLRDALDAARLADPTLAAALPEERLDRLFDPSAQRGDADRMIDRTLAAWRAG